VRLTVSLLLTLTEPLQSIEMPEFAATDEFLSLLGSSSFIPALHNHLRGSSVGTLPLDPAILQAILTCIVAGDKNLILHAPEEDLSLVVRLTSWVSSLSALSFLGVLSV
jgi:hypothetical protein